MKNRFAMQIKVAKRLGTTFEVHSKTPIPDIWKQWFGKKDIRFGGLNMSVFYSVEIVLNLRYEKNNIDCFFQKCLENNMLLYTNPFDNLLNELDSSDAAAKILAIEIEDEERRVYTKFQDTDFFIAVYKEKNNILSFSISGFGPTWEKDFFHDHYSIDFARYIRLLLRICRDFTILELKTNAI